jgi:hypothetical protein
MAYTIYRSTDAGAPTLSGNTASLMPLLDAILVNGYGSKPAAGWTKPFSSTNKAVYRNAANAIARSYFRVVDTAANYTAKVRGYDTMTDVDTGTGPFPLTSDITGDGLDIPKSSAVNGTVRDWIAAADERTLVLFVQYDGTNWEMCYLGDGIPDVANNTNFSILAARGPDNVVSFTLTMFFSAPTSQTGSRGIYIKGYYGFTNPKLCRLFSGPNMYGAAIGYFNMSSLGGMLAMPNDNSIYLFQPPLAFYDGFAYWLRQGLYRFIYVPAHRPEQFSHGDTFNGVGVLSGKSFEIIKPVQTHGGQSAAASGIIALVTSNPD